MPELPDVEMFKMYFDATSLNKKISRVESTKNRVFQTTSQKLDNELKGHSFTGSLRHGKYLLGKLDNDHYLLFHFGMTGNLQYFKIDTDSPVHTPLLIVFNNGFCLAYINVRKFGKIDFINSVDDFLEKYKQGPDVLEMSQEDFVKLMKNKNGMIKSVLMDQHTLSGIGNIYSDEILFQEKIYPKTKTNKLKNNELEKIYSTIQRVLKTAIRHQANPKKFPSTYLTRHRDDGATCPVCKGKIINETIAGRSAFYCSSHQKSK